MTKTKFLICLAITGLLMTVAAVLAADVQYPVEELDNCQDKAACKAYCDSPKNMEACLNFAEKKNLMTKGEIDTAKKFTTANIKKPGDCTTKNSCEEYCNDINHIDECITFATENDLIPPKDLAEAKKVQAAIKRGVKPPACGNKKACDTYCDSPDHMEECVNFAMEAGFMSEQEKANSQKMLVALKKGVKPPNCKGKEGCDVYCGQEEHFEECLNFAEAAGFMNPEEAKMSRKTGGKGPGGCKGKNECEAFCNNPDNQETCFTFGKENGLIPEKDLKRMEQGKQQFKQSMEQAPQEVLNCLNAQLGNDMLEKLKTGAVMPPKEIGESMRGCYEKIRPMPGQEGQGGPGGGGMTPGGQAGPGGCKTHEECQSYCTANPQECQNFKAPTPTNSGSTGQGGPAGGSGGGMGISNEGLEEMIKIQPVCESPEQCQQLQQQMAPPPNQSGGGQMPQPSTHPQQYQQPPQQPAPEGTTPPPSGFLSPQNFIGSIISVLNQTFHAGNHALTKKPRQTTRGKNARNKP